MRWLDPTDARKTDRRRRHPGLLLDRDALAAPAGHSEESVRCAGHPLTCDEKRGSAKRFYRGCERMAGRNHVWMAPRETLHNGVQGPNRAHPFARNGQEWNSAGT